MQNVQNAITMVSLPSNSFSTVSAQLKSVPEFETAPPERTLRGEASLQCPAPPAYTPACISVHLLLSEVMGLSQKFTG